MLEITLPNANQIEQLINKDKEVTVFEETTTTGYSSLINVSRHSTAIISIGGSFTGNVRMFQRNLIQTADIFLSNALDLSTNKYLTSTEIQNMKSGIYLVDLTELNILRAQVQTLTTGAVTVKFKLFKNPLPKRKNVILGEFKDITVEGKGFATLIDNMPLHDYPLYYVTAVSSGAEISHFRMNARYNFPLPFQESPIDTRTNVANSGWIEAKGTSMRVYLVNANDDQRTFTVIIYGVG